MKKVILMLSLCGLLFSVGGCIKDTGCQSKTVESEQAAILNFAAANSITPVRHSSGIYYQIVNPGSGAAPTLSSTLTVRYIGKRMDGTVFDQTTASPAIFLLGQVIPGWQIGLPLIQKGGTIRLIIPSSLAYNCSGQGSIAPYSILYFEIELIDVS